ALAVLPDCAAKPRWRSGRGLMPWSVERSELRAPLQITKLIILRQRLLAGAYRWLMDIKHRSRRSARRAPQGKPLLIISAVKHLTRYREQEAAWQIGLFAKPNWKRSANISAKQLMQWCVSP